MPQDDEDDVGPLGFPGMGPPGMGPPGMPPGPGPMGGRGAAHGQGGFGAQRGAAGQGGAAGQEPLPRVGAAPGEAAGDDGNKPAARGRASSRRGGADKGPAASVPDVTSYDVCAQILGFRGRRLTVSVQSRYFKASRVSVELTSDAEIALNISDLSAVKPGDKVSARGFYVTPGVCETGSLTVTLANPLGKPGSHVRRPRPAGNDGDTTRQSGEKAKSKPPAAGRVAPAAEEKVPNFRPRKRPRRPTKHPRRKSRTL